jgi:pilus assembly protein TadC
MNEGIEKPFFVSALLAYGLYLAVSIVSNAIAFMWFGDGYPGSDLGALGFVISWFPSFLILVTSLTLWRMSKYAVLLLFVLDAMAAYFVYSNENSTEAIQNLMFAGGSLGYTGYALQLHRLGKLT